MFSKIKNFILRLFKKQKCYYINGPETLPAPLSKDKEREIMEQIKNGDDTNRELLIVHNLRLVVYIAKKLATYASRCIENEILMHLRKVNNMKSEMSFDEPLSVDWDGNELTLRDVLGTEPDDVYEELEYDDEKRLLLRIVNSLPEKEKNLMIMRFGLDGGSGHTQKQLADSLGISQSYISRLEKRILAKIKNEIERHIA